MDTFDSMVAAPGGAASDPSEVAAGAQRKRILDAALRLMAEAGVHAMSMRRLATECSLNVATIYHYFPSKADLLQQVIAHQSYDELLAQTPPIDADLEPAPRLAEMLVWIWAEMGTQEDMWRLLLGESLRGEPDALAAAAELSAVFEAALDRWLLELFDDLPGERRAVARVLRGAIYGFFIEHLVLPPESRLRHLRPRADDLARTIARV